MVATRGSLRKRPGKGGAKSPPAGARGGEASSGAASGGWSPFLAFRVGFYLIMTYEMIDGHGDSPLVGWKQAFRYPASAWASRLAATTEAGVARFGTLRLALAALAALPGAATPTLLGVRDARGGAWRVVALASDAAATVFPLTMLLWLSTVASNFTNHHYLFTLISFLIAFSVHSSEAGKRAWGHAMRGQIVVVYFYAALWKLHPDWRDGTIVKGIFLSFEDQGVARGVPWAAIDAACPAVWLVVAWGGLLIDGALALSLFLLKPGHRSQLLCVVFHGFTALTMSPRIGYSFPATMVLSALLFVPRRGSVLSKVVWDDDGDDANEDDDFARPHGDWLAGAVRRGRPRRAVAWILVQFLVPARLPLLHGMGRAMHTAESYRCAWTMMMHSHSNTLFGGKTVLFDLRPRCRGQPFPSPNAQYDRFAPTNGSFNVLPMIGARGYATVSTYYNQLPVIADYLHSLMRPMCDVGGDEALTVTANVYSSTNEGPFARLVDPSVDLAFVGRRLNSRGPGQQEGAKVANFKGSYFGHFPLVSADVSTSDHLSERSRTWTSLFGTRARGTAKSKRR